MRAAPATWMKMGLAVLLASLVVASGFAATARGEDPAAPDFAAEVLTPFWDRQPMTESMFFIQAEAGQRPRSAFLFHPDKVLQVVSATRETVFEEGRDYVLDADTSSLLLPEGSRIPFKTQEQMYPLMTSDLPKIRRQGGDLTRGIFFDNQDGYHQLQVEVTYECRPGQWQGPVPKYVGDALPRLLGKLQKQEPVTVFLSGDSISEGYNASKFSKAKPNCPAYGELFALGLERQFGSQVTFRNFAVGGWQSSQGLKQADEQKLGAQRPDLVIIAYGMNDVFRRDAATFQKNVQAIMETIRRDSPETEFLLVSTMLGNAEWGMPMEEFGRYRKVLRELAGPGVVLADLTAVWEELLKKKSFYDLTGNGVNHPNDFGHRIYAQVLMRMVTPPTTK